MPLPEMVKQVEVWVRLLEDSLVKLSKMALFEA